MKKLKNIYFNDFLFFSLKKKYFTIIIVIISVSLFYIFSSTLQKNRKIYFIIETMPPVYIFEQLELLNFGGLQQNYMNLSKNVSDQVFINLLSTLNFAKFKNSYLNSSNLSPDEKQNLAYLEDLRLTVDNYDISKLGTSKLVKVSLIFNSNFKNSSDFLNKYIEHIIKQTLNDIKLIKIENINFLLQVLSESKVDSNPKNKQNYYYQMNNNIISFVENKDVTIPLIKLYLNNITNQNLNYNFIIDQNLKLENEYFKTYQALFVGLVFGLALALLLNCIFFIGHIRNQFNSNFD
jgi:hypothetical protein